ncbi:YiiX/YebB-like N1pC/P60 family cysteine hydrolase [Photobacterium alginatilyticum]|uniref:YiiX/YebB-like N1pC/P60 family cysteine hydrolase n=1 Tax=Photobacterium alginatilyticum TaxID=1775171 RepID=UPI0040676CDF
MSSVNTKVVTISKLQKGDIILSTTRDKVSKIVKYATSSKYSHARLYVGGEFIMEAIKPVVRKEKLIEVLKNDLYAVVYRMPGLTEVQKSNIVNYAKKQDGKDYDMSGAIGSRGSGIAIAGLIPTISNLIDSESDFYCSELVAFSYKSAGIKLERFSSQTTPRDLAQNSKLKYIGSLKLAGM